MIKIHSFLIPLESGLIEIKEQILSWSRIKTIRTFTLLLIVTLTSCHAITGTISNPDQLLTGTWRIEDINQGGVIDNSMVTMQFNEQGQISGSTGCNQYSSTVKTTNNAFMVSVVSSTKRACVPAVMQQEQRFLSALNDVTRYQFESETWLVLYDTSDSPRLKLIQTTPQAGVQDSRLDAPSTQQTTFQCDNTGSVTIRFIGPETIELKTKIHQTILQRVVSASGAQYSNEDMKFWNKGSEATFTEGGREQHCTLETA